MNNIKNLTFQDLLLIRLLVSPSDGLIISELKKSLEHFFFNPPSRDEWLHELQQLTEHGVLQKFGKSRFQTTTKGKKLALQKLGLDSLPSTMRWPTLKNCYLIASLLGLPAPTNEYDRRCITSADGLRASILINCFRLSTAAYSSLTQARDSLLWQQLADTTATANLQKKLVASKTIQSKPFALGAIITLFLNNLLDTERELSWEAALKQLVAKLVGARRINPEELRLAILRAATEKPVPFKQQATPELLVPTPSPIFSDESLDLKNFADHVLKVANRCPSGRVGDNKIFISHVWRLMKHDDKQFGLDLNDFKYYLTIANNQGLISLSRADLAYAMDKDAVSASETPYLNSIFHFINLEH